MPLTFYEDCNQISKLKKKPYEFKLPVFGESRTDPSFYEPTATRIANMRRSASAGVALYDYDGSRFADIAANPNLTSEQKLAEYANRLDVTTKKHFMEPARQLGVTREEISQIQNETASKVDSKIEVAKKESKDIFDRKQEIADMAKIAKSAISEGSGDPD